MHIERMTERAQERQLDAADITLCVSHVSRKKKKKKKEESH